MTRTTIDKEGNQMTDTPIPTREGTRPLGEPGRCQKCDQLIPVAYPGQPNTDNGLEVYLSGGYGEFIDSWDGDPMVWLCHECGHALMDWLGIDCHNWHTHRPDSGMHPDHHDEP